MESRQYLQISHVMSRVRHQRGSLRAAAGWQSTVGNARLQASAAAPADSRWAVAPDSCRGGSLWCHFAAGRIARMSSSYRSDIDQRETRVLGNGPRIQPLSVEELTDDLLQMLTRMIQLNYALDSRD